MSVPGFSRRGLLRTGLAGGCGCAALATGAVFDRLAAAAGPERPDLYYVFAYFSGGWDILLSLDPRDPAAFNQDNVRQTRIQPAYDLLEGSDGQLVRRSDTVFGPYIGDLADHADKLAVIRGMSMETLTHEAGRRRFITGRPPSGLQARGSAAATHLAARLGQEQPIPNLAIRVETYNVDQPNYATGLRANGLPDLIRALEPSAPRVPAAHVTQLDHLLKSVAECDVNKKSSTWRSAESSRRKAQQMVQGDLASLFDFGRPSMEGLRSRFAIPAGNAGLNSFEAQAALAAQAIIGGVSRAVSISVAGGLDTHFQEWATDQGPNQQRGFNAVARLIEELERTPYGDGGDSWLDHTVIVGFSEFSRTSMLNERGGRDHSLTNACFLAGAGIKGGTVVGASSDVGMEPRPIDLATGALDLGGEVVKPEHVFQTLLHNAGFTDDGADLRVTPLEAIRKRA